jgi:pSer/pThr/pTyr-binding forkhead associated (FHA) protein
MPSVPPIPPIQPVAPAPPPFYGQQPPPPSYAPPQQHLPPRIRASLLVDGTNQVFELRPGANVIGRSNEANLQLLDQGVSRKHIDIQFDGFSATIFDLGSTNGTNVNGHEVSRQLLQHGDVIRVGHSRLVYQQGPA